jgi:SAM-dependent methyltransferase
MTVLDIGCGDGRTTLELARHFPGTGFHGIDFSSSMIDAARANLVAQPDLEDRVQFSIGDARNLSGAVGQQRFNVVTTNRCLINIPEEREQYLALQQIAEHLADGGLFVGTENFVGGQQALNELRAAVGLPEIPIRWHNLYFDETRFLQKCGALFASSSLEEFSSSYYYVTRVVYSALCRVEGMEPNYTHPIHQVALQLPPHGDFSPIKLIVARR